MSLCRSLPIWLLLAVFVGAPRIVSAEEDFAGIEFFETKIRPVLVAKCY